MTCAAKLFSVAWRLGRNPRPGFVRQIAPAQWRVGNVLFPTFLRRGSFAKFCSRSLKFAPWCKAKSLGCFSGLSKRGVVGDVGQDIRPKPLFPSLPTPLEAARSATSERL
ncbi:hypothetical protein DSY4948 [Desulfitobacterium hafniense Y51]|uniref:Uncharacterized protein n=1 Tax=Desulfitobacterium hafniense (strain Y51) TaxID=138119 RepID=Q24MK5_DESHY|nr:hypothetical protein DSY4948 [Desulfitobacterium hafniense Y51]